MTVPNFILVVLTFSMASSFRVFVRNSPSLTSTATSFTATSERWFSARSDSGLSENTTTSNRDNKSMAFLKKIGKVGGAANKDFRYAIGIDEGPAGKTHGSKVGTRAS
jgi:hypothetical protein